MHNFSVKKNLTLKELKAKALYFLARREYSHFELFNKLKKYTQDLAQIKLVVDELVASKLLSDRRYIESYIDFKSKKFGINKIKATLIQKTANIDEVEQVLKNVDINQYEIASQLLNKKFGGILTDKDDYARQFRFLQNRGFSSDLIHKVLRSIG